MASIKDLKFDGKNYNLHTKEGMALLEKSLQELGAGRSILVDKDNNIIAGNGIVEAAGQAGLEKVKIVETTGDEIVAVKRTDMSIDSEEGREMALADNATASADLEWDEEQLKEVFDDEELEKWGLSLDGDFIATDEQEEVEQTPEPKVAIFVVSTFAREQEGGSTILAQSLPQEKADIIQNLVSSEGGPAVVAKMIGALG